MHSNPSLAASIETIDRELDAGFLHFRFRPEIERRYELDTKEERTRHLMVTGVTGLVLFDVFLISDWQMVRDVFHEAMIVRLLIFTPITLIAIFILSRRPPLVIREGLAAVHGIFSAVLILWLFTISGAPDRFSYHFGTLLIILFVTMVQRLHFQYAVVSVSGILVAQFLAISHSLIFSAAMIESEMWFYLTSASLIFFAAYALGREQRSAYLLVKRSHLLNQQLDRATKIDPLTGLWNRRHLNATLEAAWIDPESSRQTMTVILLDIDRFKTFNDTYGHMEGDRCLQRLGTCVQTALDDMAHIAVRFGGEEFLIFLAGTTATEGHRAARIIRQAIHEEGIPFPALGETAIVTASIGIATARASEVTSTELMAAADQALYDAKRAGRDCIFPRPAEPEAEVRLEARVRAVA